MDKNVIIRNFSRAARSYDRYADIQLQAAAELIGRLPKNGLKNILEIGCGTGIYTRLLEQRFGAAFLKAVDISAEMVSVAQEKLKKTSVEFIVADAEEALPDGPFDLITSNASFQWFGHFERTLGRFRDKLKKNGRLAFTMFGPRTFWELNEAFKRASLDVSVAAMEFITKERLEGLVSGSFRNVVVDEIRYCESFESLTGLLSKIKHTGTSGNGSKGRDFLGPQRLKEVEKAFRREFGGVRATHQVFFCAAQKQ